MKEKDFRKFINTIDTDASIDQRITDQLMNYEVDTLIINRNRLPVVNLKNLRGRRLISSMTKAAAVILLFAIVGTTTALAATYLVKSYKVKYEVVPESDLGPVPEREIISFGTGHKNESGTFYDAEGNLTFSYGPEDPNDEDIKFGDEAFTALGLPNLTPTYLYDNYLVQEPGYRYIKPKSDDGSEFKDELFVSFFTVGSSKHVYLDFFPQETSTQDITLSIPTNMAEDLTNTSTYTTKGGLICNLRESEKYNIIDAIIMFDSDTLGNGFYAICFTDIQMDEAKEILDSIPITDASE